MARSSGEFGSQANEGMIKIIRKWSNDATGLAADLVCLQDSFHGLTIHLAAKGRTCS
jgi:acetylornithine/succinyldiaminopimelate/putrescine aminotransferase